MKQVLRISVEILLLFNAFTAIYGGATLIADPTGGLMQMQTSLLRDSIFKDFLIPGIFLFTTIGLFSLVLYILMFIRKTIYPMPLMVQGIVIEIWLTVQVISIPYRHFLQLVYCIIGLLLIGMAIIHLQLYARTGANKAPSL